MTVLGYPSTNFPSMMMCTVHILVLLFTKTVGMPKVSKTVHGAEKATVLI